MLRFLGRLLKVDGVVRLPVPARPEPSGRVLLRAEGLGRAPGSCFLASAESTVLPLVVQSILAPGAAVRFSPIVFTGPTGSGKTHLLWGLTYRLAGEDGAEGALPYFSASDLCGSQAGRQASGLYYREQAGERSGTACGAAELNILALDDLSRLCGKEREQREVARILDSAERSGISVLCALDRPPRTAGLIPALESRLTAGLHVPLSAPNLTLRRALLAEFAADAEIPLPEETRDVLAESFAMSAPELRGVLLTFAAEQRNSNQPLDVEAARRFASKWDARPEVTLRQIAQQTARHFSLALADLKAASRRRSVVTARAVAIYLARKLTAKTLEQIGAFFGGRDHTTVLHSFRQTERTLLRDGTLRHSVEVLQRQLQTP